MMESSEDCPYDGSVDRDDSSFGSERFVAASYEDYAREIMPLNQDDNQANEEVLGYLDKQNATLVLESQRIELVGKRLILAQGPGNEILVFVSSEQDPSNEETLSQSISENTDNIQTLPIQCGLNNLGAVSIEGIQVIERNDRLQNIDRNGILYIDQAHEVAHVDSDNNRYSSEALSYNVQEEEDTTEMVFIPTTSQVISLSNNTGLINLAGVVHPTTVMSKLHEKDEIECARKISEGSDIGSQSHADFYSSEVEEVGACSVNKEDNNNGLHDEHMGSEIETSSPTAEDSSSKLSVPPRDIDHAVSVVHITTSTHVHDQDWRTKNIQENESETEETGQPDITLPAVSTNATYVKCSNVKESLDSELFSESPLIRESSNHSDVKGGTDSSNKYNNANSETSATVKETVDEDTIESIHFPPQLPSTENIYDDSKQEDIINCNNNVHQSQNLDNKFFYPSSKNCENEMDFINSEEACSEIQTCTERTFLSLGDNSESESSFFSDNSQSKDHNLYEYDFENSSSNLDQELSRNSSLDRQPSDMVNSDDISTEVDATKVSQSGNSDLEVVTGNPTFQDVLTAVTDNSKLNENPADGKNSDSYYDNSQYLFDRVAQHKEEHSFSKMSEDANVKFFKHKQNSAFSEVNHTDEDQKSDENILAVKNAVNIDNKIKENDSMFLNMAASDEITVKPPQRTYVRKKRTSDSVGNIELFSDDFPDNEPYSTPKIFCVDKEKEQIMIDEYSSADEDGYVNLMPSTVKNTLKAKYTPVADERTISLSPESSDHLEKITNFVMDDENSVSTCGVNIDTKSKENDMFSNVAASDEITVKPPQRTYVRKKRTSDSVGNIELFSDDFPDYEPYSTPKSFCVDNEKEQIMIDDYGSADEDGYVNLMPSTVKNTIKAKYTPVADERTISLSPESSDHLEKITNFVMDDENSLNICYGTYLIETPFKPTNTVEPEEDTPKASSPDVPKVESPRSSLKKRMQTPSYERISAKIDSYKSARLWDKLMKSSPMKMKNASSAKRKIGEKVKKKIEKTLRNSNFSPISMIHHKKGQPSKKSESFLYSSFSSPEKVKICRIRFLNDNSTEKNSCAIDEPSTPTSTPELKNFQYTCSNCNFVSNKVNNLIMHLKYCELKPSTDMIDYPIYDMEKRERIRGEFSESFSTEFEICSSHNFSNGSVIHNEYAASLPTTSKALHMASDGTPNTPLSMSTKLHYHQ